MNIAIVKYNAGNIYSVVNALRRLGVEPMLTDDAELLQQADGILFPGQGEARGAMEYLKAHRLDEVIRSLRQPVFGICVGQQLLCRHSEEGNVDCIGIFDADVKRFQPQRHEDKVPGMGWNRLFSPHFPRKTEKLSPISLLPERANELFRGILPDSTNSEQDAMPYVYFVHSYYVPLCKETIAMADYIQPYSAAMHKDNFYACQFHPEKSGDVGEQILKNFLDIAKK